MDNKKMKDPMGILNLDENCEALRKEIGELKKKLTYQKLLREKQELMQELNEVNKPYICKYKEESPMLIKKKKAEQQEEMNAFINEFLNILARGN